MTVPPRIRRRECEVGADEYADDWPDTVLPLLRRIHSARGSRDIRQAQPRLADLHAPDSLGGMGTACDLLLDAIQANQHIVVVGDFDCDGATACAVGVRGLRMLGARNVSYAVPNRMVHGYGLSPALVEELAAMRPELLVTVDHGIACHAGIAAAKALGWRVLVTDHHLPGERLPPADVIVNPNLAGDAFPSKMLAGVGVMFYVLLALRRRLRDAGYFPSGGTSLSAPDLSSLLDLVAVGTVADLVPLDANNRALVGAGLRRLRAGQGCAGLSALIDISGCDMSSLNCTDIGFRIAPRINAAGRLEDMALGIECLLTDDAAQARDIAGTLDGINSERRGLQQNMVDDAQALLEGIELEGDLPAGLCLFDAQWHPGVVGLVASKVKEKTHRPTIAFAPSEPGSASLRGSARSIPGFHIRDALAAVNAMHPGLIDKFGGHAMAAGLSLHHDALPRFASAFRDYSASMLDANLLQAELLSDGELHAGEFDRRHAEALRDGGPWGQGYPEPLFDGEFEVVAWRLVGDRHLKFELGLAGQRIHAIHFGGWTGNAPPPLLRVTYRLEPDHYRGGTAIQLVILHTEQA